MKYFKNKLFLFVAVAMFGLTFTSCDEELEIWDSETLDYSGTYVYELLSEDSQATYVHFSSGLMLDIFNTSKNLSNEVWFDDHEDLFPLKSKMFLDGDPANFKSKSLNFDDLTNNLPAIVVPDEKPASAGLTLTESRDYIRTAIIEGKIIPKGATTIGGNQADSLYCKIVLYSGTVTFKSFAVPVENRENPDKEEFAWKYESVSYDDSLDETYIIAGHRYTGFPEDEYH